MKGDLDIEVRKGPLVLRPHLRRVYRPEDLVKRMAPRNVHTAIDFGKSTVSTGKSGRR